jgi:hypothetical protein
MTTLSQSDLPLDSGILRTAAQRNNVMIALLEQAMPSVGGLRRCSPAAWVGRGDQVRMMN